MLKEHKCNAIKDDNYAFPPEYDEDKNRWLYRTTENFYDSQIFYCPFCGVKLDG